MSLPLHAAHDPPRRHPRIRVDLAAKLEAAGEPRRATVADLSRGGLFCASDPAPEVGTPVTLRFRLLSQLDCQAVGRVVWRGCLGDLDGFGVAFDDTSRHMATFTSSLTSMPPKLRTIYLAGVIAPTITIG